MIRDGILRVYLAGKMSGLTFEEMNKWRIKADAALHNACYTTGMRLRVCNPVNYYNFETQDYQSDKEVMDFDLAMIKGCDLVLVNLEGLNTSIGTAIELYECLKSSIPVIAFGSNENYWGLHPWVSLCITRKEDNIDKAVEYIKNFYMR